MLDVGASGPGAETGPMLEAGASGLGTKAGLTASIGEVEQEWSKATENLAVIIGTVRMVIDNDKRCTLRHHHWNQISANSDFRRLIQFLLSKFFVIVYPQDWTTDIYKTKITTDMQPQMSDFLILAIFVFIGELPQYLTMQLSMLGSLFI